MGKANNNNNSKVGNGNKKFRKAAETSFSIKAFFKPTVKSPEVINIPVSPVKNDHVSDKDEDKKKEKEEDPVVVEIEQEEKENEVQEGKQEENEDEENVIKTKEQDEEEEEEKVVQEKEEEEKPQQVRRKRGRPAKEKDDNTVISDGSVKEVEQEEQEEEEVEENIKKRLRVRKTKVLSPPPPSPSPPNKKRNRILSPPPSPSPKKNNKILDVDQEAVNFLKSGIPTVTSKMRRRFNFFKGRADSKSPEKVEKSTPKTKKIQKTKVKKNKRMVVESDPESDEKDDFLTTTDTDSSVQEVDESDRRHRKRKKTTRPSSKKAPPQSVPIIELDEEAIAFLKSGIPTAITKAQKQLEVKKEEDDYYKTIQFFPVISHVSSSSDSTIFTRTDHSTWEQILNIKLQDINSIKNNDDDELISSLCPEKLLCTISEINSNETLMLSKNFYLCCDHIMKKTLKNPSPTDTSLLVINQIEKNLEMNLDIADDDVEDKRIPWIDKYSASLRKSQLAIHSEAVEKIDNWLRAWKEDIRDDGGKSRKFLEKRKRRNSESDFVTSDDEDHEIKTKTLLLFGPTGCGKTATVLTLAKKMGFEVVEVNFSTQRSGKEVLKRVEEATLSHRLESSKTCLLLFEDICLIESKEDEGFGAAVAQLIASSCRPIVMTMTTTFGSPINVACDCDTLLLDPKIDKKEPLFIHFPPQPPSIIVRKVLAPIVQSELFPRSDQVMPKDLKAILYSIARHCRGDIRQSINQTQLLIQTYNSKTIYNFHNYFLPYLDLNFIRKIPSSFIHKSKLKRKSFSVNNDKSFTRSNLIRNSTKKTTFNASTVSTTTFNAPTVSTTTTTTTTTTSEGIEIINSSSSNDDDKNENTEIQQVPKKIVKPKKVLQEEMMILNNLVETLEFAVELDRTNTCFENRSHHELHYDDDLKTGQSDLIKSTFSQCFSQLCSFKFPKIPEATKGDNEGGGGDVSTGEVQKIELDDEESRDSADSSLSSASILKDEFQIASLIFDNDQDLEHEKKVNELHTDLEDYCGTNGDLMTSGQFNYDNFAYVRTIIKSGKLNSVGIAAKRNRRISCYFNRVSHEIMDRICDTFDFSSELQIAKAALL